MARNAERANAVLNKWLAVKNAVIKGAKKNIQLGPCIPEECDDLDRATQWRQQLIREIGRGISLIQDSSLGDHRIRDLNDQINKKIKQKKRWEFRIKELGGPDYSTASDALSLSGIAASGGDYYYFGAAKELPGVRELFAANAEEVNEPRKSRAQLFKRITPDYFGWRDEENEDLLLAEQHQEQLWQQEQQQELQQQQQQEEQLLQKVGAASAADVAKGMAAAAARKAQRGKHKQDTEESSSSSSSSSSSKKFQVYVDLPTDAEISRLLLEKKKQIIVNKYATPEAQKQQQETRRLVAPLD